MAVKRNLTDEKGKKVKISQSEIDAVKKMGMKAALAAAGKNPVAGASSSDSENFKQAKVVEAVRRLYGETRFQNAIYKAKASPGPIGYNPQSGNMPDMKKPKANEQNREPAKPKASTNSNTANIREGRVAAPKPKALTPYQKDMARRGIKVD